MDVERKSNLAKVEWLANLLKKLIGLIAPLFQAASWYDPTFWGLLALSPVIASEVAKPALFLSFLLAIALLILYWKELKKLPRKRNINLRRNLIAAIVSSFGSVVLINLTATYQANNPPSSTSSAISSRFLLQGEYVAFVSLTVFFIVRIALRLYPQ